ncbi:hypothetical protein [Fusobacterium necrophorum]|uniref:hypothetical protein n=1 Tax=Fusobacterium necrophorum TaxID=859 RepID=UPI0011C42BF4|nr:hypothetical protein [Fusobacterium necrophorum]
MMRYKILLLIIIMNILISWYFFEKTFSGIKEIAKVTLENKKDIYILFHSKDPTFDIKTDEKLKEINNFLKEIEENK